MPNQTTYQQIARATIEDYAEPTTSPILDQKDLAQATTSFDFVSSSGPSTSIISESQLLIKNPLTGFACKSMVTPIKSINDAIKSGYKTIIKNDVANGPNILGEMSLGTYVGYDSAMNITNGR